VRDATADPDRLGRTVLVLADPDDPLRTAFRDAYRDARCTDAEARRHFVILGGPDADLPAEPGARGPWGALTASTLVPAALAGVDVAELLDEAELLAPSLAADSDNPALALGVALGTAPGPIALVSDGTGFEGLDEWAAELLDGIVEVGPGGITLTYGGALVPGAVPGGGTRPDVAINGPLGAQLLAWQYAAAIAAHLRGRAPAPITD
jgi:glucose-6-phosphate isomerase